MAKTNKQQIMALCKAIEKKEGEGSIFHLGSNKTNLKIPRWSTGIEDLDHILGGGMPEGRIVEIFGPESSGKTSLAYHLCALHSLCLNVPIEGTFDGARAKSFGNTPKQMLIYRPKYGEAAMSKLMKFAVAGIPLEVLDSVPACVPKDEKQKTREKLEDSSPTIGAVARLMSRTLPELEDIIEVSGTTVILINQIRDKMNAVMFGEQTDTPGGRAIKFYSSIRLQVGRKKWIEIPNKDPRNSAKMQKVGLIMKVKVVKSKVCDPQGECEIPMFFDRGFVSFDDINVIRKELMGNKAYLLDEEDEDDE